MQSNNQLKCLFDYTKFHIGVYMTLIGLLLATVIKPGALDNMPHHVYQVIRVVIICYVLAGAAGGAIISNIPNYETFKQYDDERLPIFSFKTLKYRHWATIEHGAFWIGSITLIVGLLFFTGCHAQCSTPSR